jgi:hypothetical protein
MNFQKSYRQINGHDPTPEKILKFERTCAALQTTPNDALLCILVALDHYENLYSTIPVKIKKSLDETLIGLQGAMDIQAHTSVNAVQASLIESVSKAAHMVAKDVGVKQKWQWICGTVIAMCLCVGTLAWLFHKMGLQDGYSLGYGIGHQVARDEIAAAAWANTLDGKLAFQLATSTRISDFVNCSGPGWQVQNGICYPFASPDGKVTGWRLP